MQGACLWQWRDLLPQGSDLLSFWHVLAFQWGEVDLILGKELNCSMHTTVGAAKRVLATTVGKVSAARTHMPNLQIYNVT
jgi:hypothetical protein